METYVLDSDNLLQRPTAEQKNGLNDLGINWEFNNRQRELDEGLVLKRDEPTAVESNTSLEVATNTVPNNDNILDSTSSSSTTTVITTTTTEHPNNTIALSHHSSGVLLIWSIVGINIAFLCTLIRKKIIKMNRKKKRMEEHHHALIVDGHPETAMIEKV